MSFLCLRRSVAFGVASCGTVNTSVVSALVFIGGLVRVGRRLIAFGGFVRCLVVVLGLDGFGVVLDLFVGLGSLDRGLFQFGFGVFHHLVGRLARGGLLVLGLGRSDGLATAAGDAGPAGL